MEALFLKPLADTFRDRYYGLVIENFTCKDPTMGELNFFTLDIVAGEECDQHVRTTHFCVESKFQKVFDQIFSEMPPNVQNL